MFGKSIITTGLTSVETLKNQVVSSISLFTTIRENLKKTQEKLTQQITLRNEEITKLSEERQSLDELYVKSGNVIDKIDQILS